MTITHPGDIIQDSALMDEILRRAPDDVRALYRARVTLANLRGNPQLRDVIADDIGRLIRAAISQDGGGAPESHAEVSIETLTLAGYRPEVADYFAEKLVHAPRRAASTRRFNAVALLFVAANAAGWALAFNMWSL